MKDVRELVYDDEPLPAVVRLEPGIGDGWREQDCEAVGRIRRGEAIRCVDVVGEREIDDAARRMELSGQQAKRALRFRSGLNGDAAIAGPEMDAEVLGVKGSPTAGRVYLTCRWRSEESQQEQCASCVEITAPFPAGNPRSPSRPLARSAADPQDSRASPPARESS